jgi:predicted HTH domain antitoxin
LTTESIKKTITLPKELELEVEKRLIGKYYENLSDAIRDGLRKILSEYEKKNEIEIAAVLYKEGKITMREVAAIMGVPLRKALEELAQRGVYLRYGAEELEEDLR